jgi:hypothetical protein
MKRGRITITGIFWLQLVTCIFLITLGIVGLTEGSRAALRNDGIFRGDSFRVIASIMELGGGVILLVALFAALRARFLFWVGVVLFALWLMLILEAFFMRGFLEPNSMIWANRLSWHGIPAVVLWIVARQYR